MFDWVTWGIWLVGFIILVIWIIVPMKEFVGIVKSQHATYKKRAADKAPETTQGGHENDA